MHIVNDFVRSVGVTCVTFVDLRVNHFKIREHMPLKRFDRCEDAASHGGAVLHDGV